MLLSKIDRTPSTTALIIQKLKKKKKMKPTYKTGSTEHLTVKTQIEVLVTAGMS